MKSYLTYLFAAIFIVGLIACGDDSAKDDSEKSKYEYETVDGDPLGVKIYTLSNGLKVYLSVNKDEPRIQTAITVRAGSKNDPSDCTGLAHYLEHMLFKGSSKIASINWEEEKKLLDMISAAYEEHKATDDTEKKKEIYLRIDSLSSEASKHVVPNEYDKMVSSMGARGTNAFTSTERTVYINDIPANELEKWMLLESERFSELVLRIFHTELETVYEEFNRGQDNDYRKTFQLMDSIMFQNHTYGTQTTIGLGEHLKNPSMVRIHDYFNTYYVPNNIAICLAGDLDPDQTIDLIEKYFGHFEPKDVPEFTFEPEDPINEPIIAEVNGPMAEWVNIGFRFPGIHKDDKKILTLISGILHNGTAGLIDLNINQKQKALSANAYYSVDHDYSQFILRGEAKQGQSLEEVRELLLAEIDKVKNGQFEDWLIQAVIKDLRKSEISQAESNWIRAYVMGNAFIMQQDWADYVHRFDALENITKDQILKYANENFGDNYIVVNKRTGENPNTYKVEKPQITPLELNRDTNSVFYAMFDTMPGMRLEPLFLDYEKDIQKAKLDKGIPFNYIKNNTNELFSLYYLLDMGTNNDPLLNLAIDYLPYLGSSKHSAEELKKEFFKLGIDFDVYTSEDRVYVSLNGLEESMEVGMKLFEEVLADPQPDETALAELVNDELKEREDNKKNKWSILYGGMFNYARYGAESPFTAVLTSDELHDVKAEDLCEKIKSINQFKHRIFYYGAMEPDKVVDALNKHHQTPDQLNEYPAAAEYTELETNENKVYFVDYDQVQTELMMVSKDEVFNKELMPQAQLFNEYFGSGLSSIVFQEIREAKALAYTAYSSFTTPRLKEDAHYARAYVGTQSDKLGDAVEAMLALMDDMPKAEKQFEDAKLSAIKNIESQRITKSRIFWNSEAARRRGLNYDIRRDNYEKIKNVSLDDLAAFFDAHIKGRNYTYLALGKKSDVDFEALKKLGPVKELTLEEVFGY